MTNALIKINFYLLKYEKIKINHIISNKWHNNI